jgi:predicted dehydrogenase
MVDNATDPIRWGILGTGGIAESFTKDLLATGLTVTAVGSRTQEAADAFAKRHQIHTAHESYEALAADPDVDIIYVSTPHPYHASNATLALNNGKHVLVEKPFTINAAEAKSVVDLAEKKGLVVLEAMWTRWLPHMVRIRAILAAGTIGEVRTVIADHTQSIAHIQRMYDPELGGGALLDLGIYPISFAWDVFGKPESITAVATKLPTGVDQHTSAILSYSGGRQALVSAELDALGPNRAAVIGTGGRIEIDSVWYTPTPFRVYDNDGVLLEAFDVPSSTRGMEHQAREAERLIRAGKTVGDILSPRETVEIMETLDAIRAQIGLTYPSEKKK